jgi:hypothetical protein
LNRSAQKAALQLESFCFAHWRIVSLDNRAGSQNFGDRVGNHGFTLIHRQSQRLEHQEFAIAVDNYSGQAVALAPDNSPDLWIDLSAVAVFRSLRDPTLEEIEIETLPLPGETAGHDLRFRVVNRAADQLITPVL